MYRTYSYNNKKESGVMKTCAALSSSIVKCGRDFCLYTSMHGFNHIAVAGRHLLERLLWVTITAAAIWGALDISLGQLQRYNENPTVVALEKDFRTWNFTFPALTSCAKNRVDPKKLPVVIKELWDVDSDHEKYGYYSKFVATVANSDLFNLTGFHEFKDDESLNVDLAKLVIDVMPEFAVKATFSDINDRVWTPVMTEAGACYSINSLAIADTAIVKPDPNVTKTCLTCKYSSQSCYVICEINLSTDFYFHSPYDVVDITIPPSKVFTTLNRVTELSVMETFCGKGVKELSPQRRGCHYTDEPTQKGRQVYSTNTCRLSCRSRLAIKLCGCKPFYYFYEEGIPCTPSGMSCLSSYGHQLASNGGDRCSCSQQCEDATYKEIITTDQYWDKGPFVKRGSVRFVMQAPRTRYTREIVFYFQDLVVSFGGAAGLFLGASFISFVEIFYFVLERILKACVADDTSKEEVVMTIMRTAKEWNALPADLFPEQYNLGLFKARVNRHFSRCVWRTLGRLSSGQKSVPHYACQFAVSTLEL